MFINATVDNLDVFMEVLNQFCNLLNTEKLLSHSDEVTCNVQSIRNIEKNGSFLESHTLMLVAKETGQSFSFNNLFGQTNIF